MIRVLAEIMTDCNDNSLKVGVLEFKTLEDFKKEILRYCPKITVSIPKNGDLWFGIQYGNAADGFWFRWLKAIVDTERGCLYSFGDRTCDEYFGLPLGRQHCSREVYTLLLELESECKRSDVVL